MKAYSIVFADPDKNMHDGHRRLIKALRPEWSVAFALTGREAMNKINSLRPHAVVAELEMELENGGDLFKTVQKVYPEIIRIVLSGEPDGSSEAVLRATQSAHRFLAKPFKGEQLIEQIEKAADLRRFLRNPELVEVVGGIPYLPSLPGLYHELMAAVESPLISLQQIGDIIARDVSMTTRILHLVNSAFFGLPRQVTNPQTAVVLLGINVIKALVCYVKLFFAAPDNIIPGLSIDRLWAHSSMAAQLAKQIAADLKASPQAQEEAFLAGMLHDIGKLLLLEHPRYYHRVLNSISDKDEKAFSEAEYQVFSTSHAEAGAYLLGLWGLPDNVVEAVACHHRPDRLQFMNSPVLIATHLANVLLCKADKEPVSINQAIHNLPEVKKMFEIWQKKADQLVQESRK
ncbi:MAG: HDOD domain-containing protein [Candidatus Rifleibacteriota bacterium]